MIEHRKLRIETRLKLLAKWNPKKYGDRLDIGNADGEPFKIATEVEIADASRLLALLQVLERRANGEVDQFDGSDLV
jgi:hypothetical protein